MRAARQLRSMDLILPLAFRATMSDAAHATPDREICGLLLGEGLRVTNILPAANSAPDPATGFAIDPRSSAATTPTPMARPSPLPAMPRQQSRAVCG